MDILVFGAGAIGSLFGGLLSKDNDVVLVGRKSHIDKINKKGLQIEGMTNLKADLLAVENIKNISFSPDIIILSVKSFDTLKAVENIKKLVKKNTIIISLQNGLNNIEKIKKHVDEKQIVICITTHGSVFLKSGCIKHTGIGETILGGISNDLDIRPIASILNSAGIKTSISKNILGDMWIKAIINSSINPLTSIFNCKNGYLHKNPVLKRIVEKVCEESTNISKSCGYDFEYNDMISKTHDVISDTKDNFSSMLQSIKKNRKTEIDSINGIFVKKGEQKNLDVNLNNLLLYLVKSLEV